MPHLDPEIARARARERYRQRTAERAERGLCVRCGKRRPAPGRSTCETCGEKRRVADRARAATRREAGIKRVRNSEDRKAEYRRARARAQAHLAQGNCAKCGERPHEPGRRLCSPCGERARTRDRERYRRARVEGCLYGGKDPARKRRQARRRSRARRRNRLESSLCVRCGRLPPVEDGSSCATCLKARRASDRAAYALLRAAGLCTRCRLPAFDSAPVCGPCTVLEDRYREKRNESARSRYDERRRRYVCTHCGSNPTFGASRCDPCATRAYARSDHAKGLPVYPPGFTVIERATDEPLGTWDCWEDVLLMLAFERLSLDEVEVLHEHAPMQPVLTGLA